VAGNLMLFAPWRKGQEPRERLHDRSRHNAPALTGCSTGLGPRPTGTAETLTLERRVAALDDSGLGNVPMRGLMQQREDM
jgi:hypothetical protein